ncbi:hypothetical protein [Enterovirga sp. CN4-39]|uniref:hypothetical protein n=1 Tax=Enterovirga sp. CN4-39 TaxID=3400910 RepID=UPI003C063AD8
MAYSTSAPPVAMHHAGIANPTGAQHWALSGTDAVTAVRVTGYISNAKTLGMKKGDIVWYTKTDASPITCQIMIVSAINANGSADLSDGVAVTGTNTD